MTTEARPTRIADLDTQPLNPTTLVGSYFLGDVNHQWQGCIVAEPAPGHYLAETFSWQTGATYYQQLITLHQITEWGWSFYDTAEHMRYTHDHSIGAIWQRDEAFDAC